MTDKNFHQVAEEEGFYAATGWAVEDVQEAAKKRGKRMTKDEAIRFLQDNQNHITDDMVRAGWDSIDACLDFFEGGEDLTEKMSDLGWYEWQTGGGCTAYGFNLPCGGQVFNDPRWDGRYLLITDEGGGCVPTWGDPIIVGLYDLHGEIVETLSFYDIEDFLESWDF